MEILMVYLMGYHWEYKMLFIDGVDGGFLLGMLFVSDVGFEDGIKDGFILGPFI